MRVALDATPILGRPTGVGRYVRGLLGGLAELPDRPELVLTAFSRSGGEPDIPGVRWSRRRVPARLLQAAWSRTSLPPVEWLAGRCDVFHATNFVLPPRRRAAGVVTVHDLTFLRYPDLVTPAVARYRHLVPRAVRDAAVVLVPSAAVAGELADRYSADADKIRVARPGVDPSWAAARPPDPAWLKERGLPSSYVLAVGTLEPRKNLVLLTDAHARLRRSDPGAPELVIVGPPGWGPLLRLGDGTHLTGWLEDPDLQRLVAGAACLAFPSLYEGYGLPPLEALACGTPVVACDLPVLREVLGTHAALVPPGDADALAAAIARAVGDDDPMRRAAGRAHARTRTWAAFATDVLAAYRLAGS